MRNVVKPSVTGGGAGTDEVNHPEDHDPEVGHRRSFLLRLWSSRDRGNLAWQSSLEDPHTGERVGFASLEHLFAYLMELSERARV